jgi:hypothetical protein
MARLKLDYERQCYKRAEESVRSRLKLLQASGSCEIEPARRSRPAEQANWTGDREDRRNQEREKFAHSAVLVDFRKRYATQTCLDRSGFFGSISWPLARITKSVYLVDQTPVRVVGTPFVPNTNPRQR